MATTIATGMSIQEPTVSAFKPVVDKIKLLYPAVNEDETPLPRSWSPKDKYNYIGLSQNNLRVHYKGVGKTHKDAASVRAMHPIPASCGIYYFEVKIISKGRDGYMGIGLSAQAVSMNRLPGWDKHSYGYHGDDGHSFCSSGTGQPYGPTFTTGDVIGCCVNVIDNTCFYTKNGINLGITFTDLPHNLYPTVGLQTPGEVVEANFGQCPFVFDIEDYMKEWKMKTKLTIERFPVCDKKGKWQTDLQKIVSTYLVHHGYCATAEAFAKSSGQSFEEEHTSMKNRQRIQRLVLAGRMGEAIDTTMQLYPGLLEHNTNLLFMLKCRQFIEMVNGTDSEVRGPAIRSPRSQHGNSSPNISPAHHHATHIIHKPSPLGSGNSSPSRNAMTTGSNSPSRTKAHSGPDTQLDGLQTLSESVLDLNTANVAVNGVVTDLSPRLIENESDVEMTEGRIEDVALSNGTSNGTVYMNGSNEDCHANDMDIDCPSQRLQLCGGSQTAIEKMLQFGRELQAMCTALRREYGKNESNKRAMQDAFSLLAYPDPWTSPIGFQLDPEQRESVCAALNSAILESSGLPKQPPLELAIAQASQCMRLMSKAAIGSCAFASVADYLH